MRALVALVMLVAAPAFADDPVRLRIGTLAIEGSRYMKDMAALGADIERRTRGAVILDWVGGGQLGEEAAMATLVATGKLDGGAFAATGLEALVPEMAALSSPGLFNNAAEVDRATAAISPNVRDLFAGHDLTFAMWADLGFAQVFADKPYTAVSDVLTAPGMGMPLDGKLTEAIASGRARAWAVPPLYMIAIGTKPRVMSNLRHHYVAGGLVLGARAWARVTAADQAKVRAAFAEWEPKLRASWRKENDRGLAALLKSGVTMQAATLEEARAFVATAAKQRPRTELGTAIATAIGR